MIKCTSTGLATAYKKQGYLNKAIDLELTNAKILTRLIGEKEENAALYGKDLCHSYEAIARVYGTLENPTMALKYWRQAAETRHIDIWVIHTYLEDLSKVSDEMKWGETWQLLQYAHGSPHVEGCSALTAYILDNMWPETNPTSFFVLSGTAMRQTGRLAWLEGAYNTAIAAAATKSHMSVLILKLSLARLFIEYMHDFTKAEPLVEEIVKVSSVVHSIPLQNLERCKEACAKDFCQICIRQALQSGLEMVEDHRLRGIENLLKSGIEPSYVTVKIFWGEKSLLYMALLQRLTGSIEAATETLKPYMNACMILMRGTTQQQQGIGQWMLGVSLLVLGENEDGLAMVRHIYSSTGWRCSGCRDVVVGPEIAQICQCCLEFFCSECVAQIYLPRYQSLSKHR
jgi:hypothetical protein